MMSKRIAAVTSGLTVVGVIWALSFKTHTHQLAALASPMPSTPDSPLASPTPTPQSPSSGALVASPTPTPSVAAKVSGSFTGPDITNRYGDVQVKVVVNDGRISDVQALSLPQDREESAYISSQAGPLLRQEVITAQSANIAIISGATFTSMSYQQSAAAALRAVHLG
jgi:uncharacterized protein with FMN-binding domain